jgi:hypothetical protein
MWSVVDNDTSIPVYTDKPRGSSPRRNTSSFWSGPPNAGFRDLLYALRKARSTPLWVPTFNDDISLGYGYPNPMGLPIRRSLGESITCCSVSTARLRSRRYRLIDGSRRRYSAIGTFSRGSFMSLKRLDVDDIEIQHYGTTGQDQRR